MSPLEQLPDELIDNITSFLPLRDICNVPLTSRTLARTVFSCWSLQRHLQRKHVDLTERSLLSQVEATSQPNHPACLIQDPIVVGIKNYTAFLTDPLKRAKEGTAQAALERQQWKTVTQKAQGAGENACLCSRRPPTNSNLSKSPRPYFPWGSSLPGTKRCGISQERAVEENHARRRRPLEVDLARCGGHVSYGAGGVGGECHAWNSKVLGPLLGSLKGLAVSFSDRVIDESLKDLDIASDSADDSDEVEYDGTRAVEEIQAEASHASTFEGLRALVRACRGLESLELYRCDLRLINDRCIDYQRERFLHLIAKTVPLPPLKRLVLRGFHVRSADLLAILKRLRPTLVEPSLENITLLPGESFGSVFAYCTSESAGLRRLYLDDLVEVKVPLGGSWTGLLYFTGEPNKEPKFITDRGPLSGSNTVDRAVPAQVRQPIPYFTANFPTKV
ncbi:hypothetical protein BJY04DRAFT_216225 [Aspergillus karnatakaensis]|uniref:F-box protein n=1 Tax=Aspergillus karnatakaensis TaxID=1810916 RepID=UPI003CCDC7DA